MYHYWSFKGIDALVSAGLGGSSLIYANVFIRKDETGSSRRPWPTVGYGTGRSPRRPRSALRRRRQMLDLPRRYAVQPQPYALDAPERSPSRRRPRPTASVAAPAQAGGDVRNPDRPRCRARRSSRSSRTCTAAHAPRASCATVRRRLQLRSDTLDYNYLTHAQQPRPIRTLADVHRIRPRASGSRLRGHVRRPRRASRGAGHLRADLDHLILSAGTLGTTKPAAATAARFHASRASWAAASAATATC